MNRYCLLLTLFLAPLFGAEKSIRIDHRVFPGLHLMDGHWAALLAASDGKVYAGLAYHGGDGHLVYYDSKTDRVVDVGDLTELTGESHLKRGPQSKIHAKFGEGKDGRIYYGTHAGQLVELLPLRHEGGLPRRALDGVRPQDRPRGGFRTGRSQPGR